MSFSIIYFLFSFICLVVWPNKKTFANSYLFFSFHYSSRLFLFFSFRSFLLSCDYLWYQMHLIERISFLFFSLFIYHSLTHFTLSLPLLFFHFYIFVYFFFFFVFPFYIYTYFLINILSTTIHDKWHVKSLCKILKARETPLRVCL